MPNWKKVIVSGSNAALNSLSVTTNVVAQSFTGSLFGTSSFATSALSAISASYAATASSADNFLIRQDATASNLLVNNTITAQTLVVQTVTSSIVYSSGSNIFGNQLTDIQQFTGSLRVTGSGPHYIMGGNFGINDTNPQYRLAVAGDANITANLTATGSIIFPSLSNVNQVNVVGYNTSTGQLFYQTTSSVSSAISASYAATASFANSGFNIGISEIQTATVASSVVGSNNLFTTSTGSFTGAKYLYTVSSGSNARMGEVFAIWNSGTAQFTDVSTLDIGSTTVVTASVTIVTAQAQLNFQTNTSGWLIKSQATFI
jgi:hypothetical protein